MSLVLTPQTEQAAWNDTRIGRFTASTFWALMVPELQVKTMEGRTKGGIRREVARAKWERITTHTARRSFASNCYRDGIPARTIMAVTGHQTEQAFMRYIRLTNEEHADIMARSSLFTIPVLKAV